MQLLSAVLSVHACCNSQVAYGIDDLYQVVMNM